MVVDSDCSFYKAASEDKSDDSVLLVILSMLLVLLYMMLDVKRSWRYDQALHV